MVCVPCIVIPFFLFIWHKFLQPIFLRFWNPFGQVEEPKKDEVKAEGKAGDDDSNSEKTVKGDKTETATTLTNSKENSHTKSD